MTRPKVIMLITQLGYGGAETSFIRLANFLAQSMDVTVALFTKHYGRGSYADGHEPLHVPVVLLDSAQHRTQLQRWWHRMRAMRELKKRHDVCISFLTGPNILNALSGSQSKTIVSMRGTRFYDPTTAFLKNLLYRWILDPITYQQASAIVPISDGLANEIGKIMGQRIAPKIHVIPPFVDMDHLMQRRDELLPQHYAALNGQKVIVAVGRLAVEKGFQYLIPVFHKVAKKHNGAKLLLVGDGPMLEMLQAHCRALSLPINVFDADVSSVIFAGYQKNILPFMALGNVCAVTSYTEGFCNVIVEALAAGVPVVAANTPWGARAILYVTPQPTENPYPTISPTVADYGVLMPRVDVAEHQEVWVDVLSEHLAMPRAIDSKWMQRVRDFAIETVGAQWQQVIQSLVNR